MIKEHFGNPNNDFLDFSDIDLDTTNLGGKGKSIDRINSLLSEHIGSKYFKVVNNGTAALFASIQAVKILKGKNRLKVAVPSFTFIATYNVPYLLGCEVTLIDSKSNDWNIDPFQLNDTYDIVICTDIGGNPCSYDIIRDRVGPDTIIIADSAESFDSVYKNKIVGTQCDIHTFSFHRAKILSCGEGGGISTNNDELFSIINKVCEHGYSENREEYEYKHDFPAFNFRMTNIAAEVLIQKYNQHEDKLWVREKRRERAKIYKDYFKGIIPFQEENYGSISNYFFFGVLVNKKKEVIEHLIKNGIEAKTWIPVHKQPFYMTGIQTYPVATKLGEGNILLPCHEESNVEYIAKTLLSI